MSPPPDADDVRALREIVIEMARRPDANRYLAGLMSGLDLRYDLGDPDPLVGSDIAWPCTPAGTSTVIGCCARVAAAAELGAPPVPAPAVPAGVTG